MPVYLKDGSSPTIVSAATLRWKLQIFLPQPVPALTPQHQGSHWRASFEVTGVTRPGKNPTAQAGVDPRISRSRGGRLNHLANEAVEGEGKERRRRRRTRRSRKKIMIMWLLFVGCLTSQQHVSQGRICSDNFTCCHTEIEVADPTFHLTQSQYTDTRPTSPSDYPVAPGRVATGVPIFKSLA